jgi:hypothetical protein
MKNLTNAEIIKMEAAVNAKAKKGKIVYIGKDLSIEEQLKKPFCKIIVSYLVQHRVSSNDLAKTLKVSKRTLEYASLYKYDKLSFDFLIDTVKALAGIDQTSNEKLTLFLNSLSK